MTCRWRSGSGKAMTAAMSPRSRHLSSTGRFEVRIVEVRSPRRMISSSRSPAAVQLAHADVSDDEQGRARLVGQMGPAAPFALDSGPASSQVARGQRARHDSRRPPAARWTVSSASAALPRVSRCLGDLAARARSAPHRRPPPHELRHSPLRVPRRNYCTSEHFGREQPQRPSRRNRASVPGQSFERPGPPMIPGQNA